MMMGKYTIYGHQKINPASRATVQTLYFSLCIMHVQTQFVRAGAPSEAVVELPGHGVQGEVRVVPSSRILRYDPIGHRSHVDVSAL